MDEIIACAVGGIKLADVPGEVKLLPMGHVHSQKGDFLVDDESFEMIRQAFKDRKIDIVIDYEHQTLQDVQAPAGGWIKDLEKKDNAIVAKVEWTPKAAEYLKNKEYKYLSPVVLVRKSDHKARELHSAALTNSPAIDGMFAIVNANKIENVNINKADGGNKMELAKLIKLLGLGDDATEDQVTEAITKLLNPDSAVTEKKKEEGATNQDELVANSTILGLLGLDEKAKTEDVTAAIIACKADSGEKGETYLALKARLDQRDADDAVMTAMKNGKISAAQKEWATEYALKDPTGFAKFVDKAPASVPMGKTDVVDAPKKSDKLDDTDMLALKNMGLSDEDIKKYAVKGE